MSMISKTLQLCSETTLMKKQDRQTLFHNSKFVPQVHGIIGTPVSGRTAVGTQTHPAFAAGIVFIAPDTKFVPAVTAGHETVRR